MTTRSRHAGSSNVALGLVAALVTGAIVFAVARRSLRNAEARDRIDSLPVRPIRPMP